MKKCPKKEKYIINNIIIYNLFLLINNTNKFPLLLKNYSNG